MRAEWPLAGGRVPDVEEERRWRRAAWLVEKKYVW